MWTILAENLDTVNSLFGIQSTSNAPYLVYSQGELLFQRSVYVGANQTRVPLGKDPILHRFPSKILGLKSSGSSNYIFLQLAEAGRELVEATSSTIQNSNRILFGGIREVYAFNSARTADRLIRIPSHGPLMLQNTFALTPETHSAYFTFSEQAIQLFDVANNLDCAKLGLA